MEGNTMRTYLFMVAIFLVAGCVGRQAPSFDALSVDSPSSERVWTETEYAKEQFVKASYDSSGITLIFSGVMPPEVVQVSLATSKIPFASFLITSHELFPHSLERITSMSLASIPEEHHKWTPSETHQLAGVYSHATLWLSWKYLGLDAPPEDGFVVIFVVGMKRDGLGVRLVAEPE
jgi:hypothetical protein